MNTSKADAVKLAQDLVVALKDKPNKFMVGVPIALISHIALAALCWCGANGMIGL